MSKHYERTGIPTDTHKAALLGCLNGDDLMTSVGPIVRDKLAIEGWTSYYGGRVLLTAAGKKIAQTEKRRHAANRRRAAARVAKRTA